MLDAKRLFFIPSLCLGLLWVSCSDLPQYDPAPIIEKLDAGTIKAGAPAREALLAKERNGHKIRHGSDEFEYVCYRHDDVMLTVYACNGRLFMAVKTLLDSDEQFVYFCQPDVLAKYNNAMSQH